MLAAQGQQTYLPKASNHGRVLGPWPEIPLLSTSKQHGVQGGKFTDPSHIQSTDPGAVELEGKTSRLLTGSCLVTCSAVSECERHKVLRVALGKHAPAVSLWPGLSFCYYFGV